MSNVRIRRATTDDVEVLAAHRVTMFEHIHSLAPESRAPLLHAARDWFARELPAGSYVAWVATLRDEIIGGAGLQIRAVLPRGTATPGVIDHGPEGLVVNVYVEPEHRGQRIARRLMEELLEFTRERGILRVVLHASAQGRPLYEKLGFATTNEMRLNHVPPSPP